ncbi:MAG TPA: TonB family protein [Acidobacteriaceae bacterium]|nr:TonB family protein [Acidobacteriaceae bacterium]
MFEDSTFASASRIRTRSPRYAAGSLILQTALLAVLILIPYLYPGALPGKYLRVPLIAPPPPAVPVVQPQHAIASTMHTELLTGAIQAPQRIPTHIATIVDAAPPGPVSPGAFGAASGPNPLSLGSATPPPAQRVHPPKPTGPIHISSGVAAGQLLVPIQPHYPAIALEARVRGTVVVSALIGKDGRIARVRVLSGPPLLVPAAVDAIRQARYRPWTLNGEPVEVETTINVVFTLGDTSSSL